MTSVHMALRRADPEYCLQLWGPHFKEDVEVLERVPKRATKMSQGLKKTHG